MPREYIRKVSTLLFKGKPSDFGGWSSIAMDHRGAVNHQLTLHCSGALAAGSYRVRLIPDNETSVEASVDTGQVLDMTGVNSAIATFSGVLKGIHIEPAVPLSGGQTISLVLSSYTKVFPDSQGLNTKNYLSSNILDSKPSGYGGFSVINPRHSEMLYHQITLTSNQLLVDGKYNVRLIPDVDPSLECSVDIDKELDISGNNSAVIQFTGVIKGVHLEVIDALTIGGTISMVMSSSIERFDGLVAESIGAAPGAHVHVEADITDLDKYTQAQVDGIVDADISAHASDANTHTNLILNGGYF